jgi:hypothetical protein
MQSALSMEACLKGMKSNSESSWIDRQQQERRGQQKQCPLNFIVSNEKNNWGREKGRMFKYQRVSTGKKKP